MKNQTERPGAFIDINGMLREWTSADHLSDDWQGFAKINEVLYFVGRENGKRSFTALESKTVPEARLEMAKRLAQSVLKATAGPHSDMEAADEAFRCELVRVYGTKNACNARYKFKHSDPKVQQAKDAFVASSNTWLEILNQARKDVSAQEAVLSAPINTSTGGPEAATFSPRPRVTEATRTPT